MVRFDHVDYTGTGTSQDDHQLSFTHEPQRLVVLDLFAPLGAEDTFEYDVRGEWVVLPGSR